MKIRHLTTLLIPLLPGLYTFYANGTLSFYTAVLIAVFVVIGSLIISYIEKKLDQHKAYLDRKYILLKHEKELKALFPKAWTHARNIDKEVVGRKLKAFGLIWYSEDELNAILRSLLDHKVLVQEGDLIKSNPSPMPYE